MDTTTAVTATAAATTRTVTTSTTTVTVAGWNRTTTESFPALHTKGPLGAGPLSSTGGRFAFQQAPVRIVTGELGRLSTSGAPPVPSPTTDTRYCDAVLHGRPVSIQAGDFEVRRRPQRPSKRL